jgi:hypothetical protein
LKHATEHLQHDSRYLLLYKQIHDPTVSADCRNSTKILI